MKREDMLEKMVQCFNQCKIMRYSNDQAMDRVLEVCEEVGMLPPSTIPRITPNDMKNIWYWEPEE